MRRAAPGFFQRYEATVSHDGKTIRAHWGKSNDGAKWERDFEPAYMRAG